MRGLLLILASNSARFAIRFLKLTVCFVVIAPSSPNCTTSQYCDVISPPEVSICFLACWSTYGSSTSGVTWYEANDYCRQTGAQLVSLSVPDIQDLLVSGLRQQTLQVQEYWIGLSRNQWIWAATGEILIFLIK
jgi:hypothetical protein